MPPCPQSVLGTQITRERLSHEDAQALPGELQRLPLQNPAEQEWRPMAKKGGWQEFGGLSNAAAQQRPTAAAPSTPKAQQRVRVQRTKAGKGGKLVTAITGLEAPEAELRTLLKQLKAAAGTGGTLKDGVIELQGDQVAAALAALEQAGYRPKQAGG